MDWTKAKVELQKKLNPAHVKPPAQGKYGSYVDGHHVISEANRIFGEDGWSYSITRLELVSRIDTGNAGGSQIRVGYMATVRVQVGDSFKEGAALGSGMSKADNEADAHESAIKEAETDALKRALRTYGNTFGLALYDKTGADVGVDAPKATKEEIDAACEAIESKMTLEFLGEYWKGLNENALHVAKNNDVISAKDERKAELTRAMTNQGAG